MARKEKRAGPDAQVTGLLYQALETELGGVEIYRTALQCAQDEDLEKERREVRRLPPYFPR